MTNNNDLSKNNSDVNRDEGIEIPEMDYCTISKKAIFTLTDKDNLIPLKILMRLTCYCTYKNGLVGVFSRISKSDFAEQLNIYKGNISRYLKQLEELNYIQIFSHSPLVLQILEAPKMPKIDSIKGMLLYVATHPQEFQFHRFKKRKTAFFADFKEYEKEILVERMRKAVVPENYQGSQEEEFLFDGEILTRTDAQELNVISFLTKARHPEILIYNETTNGYIQVNQERSP
ncbi:winged helix-turn-helix domain-containing protein [Herbaspirillum sp.]|uniref:winged helix-turn-helix domain-containing protein n=1 Tax=Herbaspirillum sp. TaxID=1890675 RepID=UPI001AFD1297|nr:winged helix-turn-helix domain-containing protein [Herbaspirillum sp.]MBO9538293.1 winged helix-turn-helix domain-containing protein [Herbaspirillum sp.]